MKRTLYLPLKLFTLYILATLIISFFGPVEYEGFNKIFVLIFMFFFIIMFALGYIIGLPKANRRFGNKHYEVFESKALSFLKMSIMITLALALWGFLDYILKYGISFKNLGQAYIDAYAGYERNVGRSYSILELLNMFTGIFKYSSMILGLYYWDRLNKKWKKRLLLSISISIFYTLVLTGKMKFIGDFVIIFLSVLIAKDSFRKIKVNKKQVFAILFGGLIMFVLIQKLRYDAIGINLNNYNYAVTSHIYMNPNHTLFKVLGHEWGFPLAILMTSYLSGGYYGLSLCLSIPFEWTYGLGHSYSLAVIANRFLGLPFFFNNSYVMRMEEVYGWPAMQKWHTIFPYFASDFTFPGTIIIFFIIAKIYATTYVEALKYHNPVSLVLFTFLNIMLVFVPANNQLMIGPESYFAFIILTAYWMFNHLKYNRPRDC